MTDPVNRATDPVVSIEVGGVAASPAGSIYDIGYRNYEGPRLGRGHAVRLVELAVRLRALAGEPAPAVSSRYG